MAAPPFAGMVRTHGGIIAADPRWNWSERPDYGAPDAQATDHRHDRTTLDRPGERVAVLHRERRRLAEGRGPWSEKA